MFMLQISGLALGALSLWTYFGHQLFLAVIPTTTYKIVLFLALAISALIVINGCIGAISFKFKKKYLICLVSSVSTFQVFCCWQFWLFLLFSVFVEHFVSLDGPSFARYPQLFVHGRSSPRSFAESGACLPKWL